jgi:hypothetical protein
MRDGVVAFTAWTYERSTGALIGQMRVWPEATANGETIYRLPACATLIEPPLGVDERHKPVFLESTQQWIVVSDCRGETWFDDMRRPALVTRLGDPTNWGWVRELALVVVVLFAGCANQAPQPDSRVAGANPSCWIRCYATATSVDHNVGDQDPVLTGTRSESTTTSRSNTIGGP